MLLDERDERPGVKFNDNDLLGIPIQVVVGKSAAEGKVEASLRSNKAEKRLLPIDGASEAVLDMLGRLHDALRLSAGEIG